MQQLLLGIQYNLRGLRMGVKNPKLLLLGLVRFLVLVIISVGAALIILANYQEILNLMWHRPESLWIVWLWHLVSWLLALLLAGISALVGYLLAQILFSVVIMDLMSQITERKVAGQLKSPLNLPFFSYFWYLIRQEIPRAVLPVLISLLVLILSWFTPLGPLLTIISPLAAAIFLAWDNTDLVPARRVLAFRERRRFFRRHLIFHLGFGILFLIPVLNILLLSFAPVGATLYYIERIDSQEPVDGSSPAAP